MWYIAMLYCFFTFLYGTLLCCQSLSIATVHVIQAYQSPLKVLGCTQHGLRSAITKNEQVYEVHSSIEHMLRTSTDQLNSAVYGDILINEHVGMDLSVTSKLSTSTTTVYEHLQLETIHVYDQSVPNLSNTLDAYYLDDWMITRYNSYA